MCIRASPVSSATTNPWSLRNNSSPLSRNKTRVSWAGGMAPRLGQWSQLLGLALDPAAGGFAIGGTWSLDMELVRERIGAGSIGSEYPGMDLSL